jgi:SHS2 domain-containing protein
LTVRKRWAVFEHTADLGLYIYGDDLEELFQAAAEALTAQFTDRKTVRPTCDRRVELSAQSGEELLRSWMAELLYLFQAEGWLTAAVKFEKLGEKGLQALLTGEVYDEGRHELRAELKAVTWHGLRIERTGRAGRLRATVILDV